MNLRNILLLFLISSSLIPKEHSFVVIICSRNNEKHVEENLTSVFNQTYKHFRVIYIDDASTDATATKVRLFLETRHCSDRVTFIANKKRMYKMYNLYHTVHSCKDEEIIVELDGDDHFFDTTVLSYLNEVYQDPNVWLTYGGITVKGKLNRIQPRLIPSEIVKKGAFRDIMHEYWIFIALRSFYAGLFKKIEQCSLMHKGSFFERGSDMLQMIPMFEMAGERFHFIDRPVYVYHTDTGENDYTQDSHTQSKASLFARHKKRYHRLEYAPFFLY